MAAEGLRGPSLIAVDRCSNLAAIRSGTGVALGQLTTERTEGAASLGRRAPCHRDHVPPRSEPFDAAQIRLLPVVGDGAGLVIDDCLYEFIFVRKSS